MNIIGQRKLLQNIDKLIEDNNFPRYIILQGPNGSGKKLISSYIAQKLGATFVPCELGVDAVRDVIELSYEQTSPTVYMWADANKMSLSSKNAVLKVTEEPPQNAYFIMTVDNTNSLLGTLLSRGTVFNINPYTPAELKEFITSKFEDVKDTELEIVVNISTTPKDVMDLVEMDVRQFNKVSTVVCESIGNVNLANMLKVSSFLRYKEEDTDKYEPILFLRACMFKFLKMFLDTKDSVYSKLIKLTSSYLSDLSSKSLNKNATVDSWIIDMHKVFEGGH